MPSGQAASSPRVLKRPAASGASLEGRPEKKAKLEERPLSSCKTRVDLASLAREAQRVGFDAQEYLEDGCTVLKCPVLTEAERAEALAVARRVRASSPQEFVFLRQTGATRDKRILFSLLNRYLPFLHQLFSGIRLPGSDWSPYAHHNQIQVAIKAPGFQGYDRTLARMRSASVGHIDQPLAKQTPEGKKMCNFSASLGIVLNGATADRDDAGNLWVARGTHNKYAKVFQKIDGTPSWYRDMEKHYFRITAANRPSGSQLSYVEAMRDTTVETPLLKQLAEMQKRPKRATA